MDSQIREGIIKDMVDSGAIIRRDEPLSLNTVDKLVEYIAGKPALSAAEKARRAAERLYKPGEIVVDSRGVEYACCNDGSLRLAGGNMLKRLGKKGRRRLRRILKEGS